MGLGRFIWRLGDLRKIFLNYFRLTIDNTKIVRIFESEIKRNTVMKNAAAPQERKTVNYRTRDGRKFFIDADTCPINISLFGTRGIDLFQGTYIVTKSVLCKMAAFHNMIDVSPITED